MSDLLKYSQGGAGHRGIDTSIAGALHIQPALPRLQGEVLAVIKNAGSLGATSDEIAERLGWEKSRVRPRTSELRKAGKIDDSGLRRKSDAGISAIVWILPDHLVLRGEGDHAA